MDRGDNMLMIQFLEQQHDEENEISVTKFLDSAMARFLQ